jgi:hypothetical protein
VLNLIVIICLLFPLGVVNVIISEAIWSPNLRSNVENWLAQGFLIALPTQTLLLPFNPAVQLLMTNALPTTMICFLLLLIAYIMTFGFIGKSIAKQYIERRTTEQRPPSLMGTRARCPICGVSSRYSDQDILEDYTVKCHNCKQPFSIEPTKALMKKISQNQENESRIDI